MKQLLFILLLSTAPVFSQTNQSTVPSGFENAPGNTSDGILIGGSEIQQLFRASSLPVEWNGAVRLTGVAFRVADGAATSFSGIVPHIEIYLSTSARSPEQMVASYFGNKGPDETTVFIHDNLFLAGRNIQPANPFDLEIQFDKPFSYDPTAGNLLMYIKTTGLTTGGTSIDSNGYASLNSSPIASTGTSVPFAPGTVGAYGLINQFSWSPIPEPSSFWLFCLGACPFAMRYLKIQHR